MLLPITPCSPPFVRQWLTPGRGSGSYGARLHCDPCGCCLIRAIDPIDRMTDGWRTRLHHSDSASLGQILPNGALEFNPTQTLAQYSTGVEDLWKLGGFRTCPVIQRSCQAVQFNMTEYEIFAWRGGLCIHVSPCAMRRV